MSTSETSGRADQGAATLQRWVDDEVRVRQRMQSQPGLARLDQLAGLDGLAQMQAMLDGDLPPPPIALTLDFLLVEVARGKAVFQGKPQFRHYNPLGTVHGGWFATLLDSALGCAVHTTLETGSGYTTLEFKVNLVRALTEKVPLVRAVGEVTHRGRQVSTAEARLIGHDGRLYAHASTTCLIFEQRQG